MLEKENSKRQCCILLMRQECNKDTTSMYWYLILRKFIKNQLNIVDLLKNMETKMCWYSLSSYIIILLYLWYSLEIMLLGWLSKWLCEVVWWHWPWSQNQKQQKRWRAESRTSADWTQGLILGMQNHKTRMKDDK